MSDLDEVRERVERAERFWGRCTDDEWAAEFGYAAIKDRARLYSAFVSVLRESERQPIQHESMCRIIAEALHGRTA